MSKLALLSACAVLLAAGCSPVCSAPVHVDLILAGQRDVVRCPDQSFRDTPERIEAAHRCLRDAVAARRPFVGRINVGGPSRGEGPLHAVGRVRDREIEVFVLADVNAGNPGARVVGWRCDGFSGLSCVPSTAGTLCSSACTALVPEAPSPPFASAPNNPGELWCGPAF
ncbi:MAG: hypothetical protein JNK05_17570 [Myxococcales bacterium]|nr:hypothetical protein [Myxococcales bacterium]